MIISYTIVRDEFAHLVLGQPLIRAIVEHGRARALVHRHFPRVLKSAAIGEVCGNADRADRVRCRSGSI